jgi:hypothetical protein
VLDSRPVTFAFPFEDFLAHLRRLGFTVGIDHYLRLQSLLPRICGSCFPEDLVSLLCPLFATNEKQQETFYAAFESHLPMLSVRTQPIAHEQFPLVRKPETDAPPSRDKPAKWPYVSVVAVVFALLISIAVWKSHIAPAGEAPVPQSKVSASQTSTPIPTPTSTDRTNRPMNRAAGEAPLGQTLLEYVLQALLWLQSFLLRFPLDASMVVIIFGPLLSLVAYEWYRFKKRRSVLHKQGGRKPPHSWPIRVEGRAGSVYNSPEFSVVARRLHSRQAAESYHLDLSASVKATVGSLGYPVLQYRADTRLSEYLILVDRLSAHDHQAALFGQLAEALHIQELYVRIYFFDGDPRACWDAANRVQVRLSDVQSKYGEHRILIFGDADRLIDPVTGRLANWTSAFSVWTDRAVLTPLPTLFWGARERTLAVQFIVLPATTDALISLIEFFGGSESREGRNGSTRGPLHLATGASPSELIPILKRDLGPDLFSWVCVCAVYPELHWDLTLYLATLSCMPGDLVSEANLLRLIGLPWFRAGFIPDEIRWELIQQLSPEQEREARSAVIGLLERNPADADTFAFETQKLEVALNRYRLSRSLKQRTRARHELRRISDSGAHADYVALRSLESVRSSPLDFVLPRQLRRLVYQNGISVLGLRTVVRLALTLLVIIVAWMVLRAFGPVAIEVQTNPPGATIRINNEVRGTSNLSLKLPAGIYRLEAEKYGYIIARIPLVVNRGSSEPVQLNLQAVPPPAAVSTGALTMEQWAATSGWKLEGNWYVHRGGGLVLYPTTPSSGTFIFTALRQAGILGSGRIQWVARCIDNTSTYVLFGIDKKNIHRVEMEGGKKVKESDKSTTLKTPLSGKELQYNVKVDISPDGVITSVQEGEEWVVVDNWSASGQNPANGKFGFYLPGTDELYISHFSFTPKDSAIPSTSAKPAATRQDVLVTTEPPGATAVLDNNPAISCSTPCMFSVTPGRHVITLGHDGYQKESRDIRIVDKPMEVPPVNMRPLPNTDPAELTSTTDSRPRVSLGVLLDRSTEMRDKWDTAVAATVALARALKVEAEVFVLSFNEESELVEDYTRDIETIGERLHKIEPKGGSAMRDAIRMGIEHLRHRGRGDNRALVVLTGGNDNASVETLEHVVAAAHENKVRIYTIRVPSEGMPLANQARLALQALAEASGGRHYAVSEINDVSGVTSQLAREIVSPKTAIPNPTSR